MLRPDTPHRQACFNRKLGFFPAKRPVGVHAKVPKDSYRSLRHPFEESLHPFKGIFEYSLSQTCHIKLPQFSAVKLEYMR